MFQVNVEAVWQTVEYARRVGARSFVFASTGSLYTDKTRANSELDPVHLTAPRSFYTATKLAAEGLLGPYSSCMNILIARLYFPYGSGQNPAMLLPQLVQRVRDGNPIQLHGPDGLLLSPTTVEDVAESLTRLLKQDQSATVNVAGPEVLSLRTISEIIGREINRPACFEAHREEPTEVMAGKTDRLRAILHWAPETSFEEGLRRWLSTPTPPTHCGNGSSTQKGRAPSNPR
jgi:nucleoside-diphosphate-sugar epimerase